MHFQKNLKVAKFKNKAESTVQIRESLMFENSVNVQGIVESVLTIPRVL